MADAQQSTNTEEPVADVVTEAAPVTATEAVAAVRTTHQIFENIFGIFLGGWW